MATCIRRLLLDAGADRAFSFLKAVIGVVAQSSQGGRRPRRARARWRHPRPPLRVWRGAFHGRQRGNRVRAARRARQWDAKQARAGSRSPPPLVTAARRGHVGVVTVLPTADADVRTRNNKCDECVHGVHVGGTALVADTCRRRSRRDCEAIIAAFACVWRESAGLGRAKFSIYLPTASTSAVFNSGVRSRERRCGQHPSKLRVRDTRSRKRPTPLPMEVPRPAAAAPRGGVYTPLTTLLTTLRDHASPLPERHHSCAGTMPRLVSPLRTVIASLWTGTGAAHMSAAERSATATDTLELLTLLADTTHCANGLRAFGDTPAATVRGGSQLVVVSVGPPARAQHTSARPPTLAGMRRAPHRAARRPLRGGCRRRRRPLRRRALRRHAARRPRGRRWRRALCGRGARRRSCGRDAHGARGGHRGDGRATV